MGSAERIVFFSSSTALWGGEQSLLAFAREIAARRLADISLVSASAELVEVWRRDVNSSVRQVAASGRLGTSMIFAVQALRLPRRSTVVAFDLIVVPPLAFLAPLLRLRGIHIVIDVHDCPHPSQRMFIPIRLARRRFDAAVAVSGFAAEQVADWIATEVVHRAVPRPMRRAIAPRREKGIFHVGLIGRLDPEKRVEFAISTMGFLPNGYKLVVRGTASYGDESYVEGLRRAAALVGEGRVKFEGKALPDKVFDGLDLLFFANDREPSGRTVAEAQAWGLPVVVPDSGGAAEFVEHERDGLRFLSTDPQSAAEAILQVANDSALRERLIQGGLERAEREYSPALQSSRYLAALLRRRRSRSTRARREFQD